MYVIDFIVNSLINLYVIVLFVSIIGSWLVAFGVINRHNQVVDAILRTCHNLTEPALRPIRNFLPNLGGIDISPIFLFIGIRAVQAGLNYYVFGPALAAGY